MHTHARPIAVENVIPTVCILICTRKPLYQALLSLLCVIAPFFDAMPFDMDLFQAML
ncbi:hypothetical protein ARMSODRAFT_206531 [Armillaria solidipes]|uniref:Uncharacterized protein n=1 Tax=Armillaria solidipes TaxID=1076256 RepID=A0A2H3BCH9_9AGAR|nr:hypothetical protein ARMSODRAFT_206531 [Armillaria solidipes]